MYEFKLESKGTSVSSDVLGVGLLIELRVACSAACAQKNTNGGSTPTPPACQNGGWTTPDGKYEYHPEHLAVVCELLSVVVEGQTLPNLSRIP